MEKITYEKYKSLLNGWEDESKPGVGKYVIRVPKGKRLVQSSCGEYFLVDNSETTAFKTTKSKK